MDQYFKRLEFMVKYSATPITCRKDVPTIQVSDGIKFGPFRKGKQYSVPLWLAMILVEDESAEIEKFDYDFGRLQLVTNNENRPTPIEGLEDFSLVKFAFWDKFLHNLSLKHLTPTQNSEKYHLFLHDLLVLRLGKLLKLALNPPTEQVRRKLPREERQLLDILSEIILEWKNNVIG